MTYPDRETRRRQINADREFLRGRIARTPLGCTPPSMYGISPRTPAELRKLGPAPPRDAAPRLRARVGAGVRKVAPDLVWLAVAYAALVVWFAVLWLIT